MTAALTGCLGDGGGSTATDADDGTASATPAMTQNSKPLEVLHGWTGGDGADAIKAVTDGFKSEHPDMQVEFPAVGGGGNTTLNTVINKRLGNNNPPSSFAAWPGKNMTVGYEGAMGNIEETVWDEADLKGAFVDPAEEACKMPGGGYAAVPIGSHRLNNLFYNVSVVEEAGVDPATLESLGDLIDAMETVASETDAAPMAHAMKGPWTTLQLISAVLLGQEGYDDYMTVVNGEGGKGSLRSALKTTKTILQNHVNDDASSINWSTSVGKIVSGDAAFNHQGNWAAGFFQDNEDFNYEDDWGFVPFPGSSGLYHFHLDAFLYPGDNPTPVKSAEWLKFVGSKSAQKAFNPRKGSISMRSDLGPEAFGPFLSTNIEQFQNAENLPPTLAHGLATAPNKLVDLKSATSETFHGPFKVEDATQRFLDILEG